MNEGRFIFLDNNQSDHFLEHITNKQAHQWDGVAGSQSSIFLLKPPIILYYYMLHVVK